MCVVAVDVASGIHSVVPSLHPQPVWTSTGTTTTPSTTVDSACGLAVGTVDEPESPVCSVDNHSLLGEKPGDADSSRPIIVNNLIRTILETLAATIFPCVDMPGGRRVENTVGLWIDVDLWITATGCEHPGTVKRPLARDSKGPWRDQVFCLIRFVSSAIWL
jgi:hypothetical protein